MDSKQKMTERIQRLLKEADSEQIAKFNCEKIKPNRELSREIRRSGVAWLKKLAHCNTHPGVLKGLIIKQKE